MLVSAALGVPHSCITNSMVADNLVVIDAHVFPEGRTCECNVLSSEERMCECSFGHYWRCICCQQHVLMVQGSIPCICITYPPLVFVLILLKVLVGATLGVPYDSTVFDP